MEIASNQQLICPVRGLLNTTKMSKDGLTPTEESYRIEAINYLISVGYPKRQYHHQFRSSADDWRKRSGIFRPEEAPQPHRSGIVSAKKTATSATTPVFIGV